MHDPDFLRVLVLLINCQGKLCSMLFRLEYMSSSVIDTAGHEYLGVATAEDRGVPHDDHDPDVYPDSEAESLFSEGSDDGKKLVPFDVVEQCIDSMGYFHPAQVTDAKHAQLQKETLRALIHIDRRLLKVPDRILNVNGLPLDTFPVSSKVNSDRRFSDLPGVSVDPSGMSRTGISFHNYLAYLDDNLVYSGEMQMIGVERYPSRRDLVKRGVHTDVPPILLVCGVSGNQYEYGLQQSLIELARRFRDDFRDGAEVYFRYYNDLLFCRYGFGIERLDGFTEDEWRQWVTSTGLLHFFFRRGRG